LDRPFLCTQLQRILRPRIYGGGDGAETGGCVTLNVCPPIDSVPSRVPPGFAATLNATEPFPVPLAPDVMVIHETLLLAVHAQPLAVVTLTEPEPPAAGTVWLVGEMA
jgi:hypothetical protein